MNSSGFLSNSYSASSRFSFAGRFNRATVASPHYTASCWVSTSISFKINASST
ncbi:hypothetical protein MIMGU_mgv11b016024mg, partial [Erythranthe guttata]